ncbi:hypothetical protein CC1G_06716 [Coprinopsis cinerea okayama7|uniref:Co-chaperone HscB C-terminal oligomerisation domain-containing protein n=1 Tax=Coprinopsis cinerea (strain Okayama-7 / 130 / ATCC MYA-4618 / FGSC 9003) TaxID=240176 RepID=A8N1N6_COPC7|nr:hypothetical protein CC1G_06716 [Coprinopsis cinerea okayama7\|eukprot:XP_001828730.2 hypothetical protein CC1G_06716 [Coprinopsis cinerea okayama7\
MFRGCTVWAVAGRPLTPRLLHRPLPRRVYFHSSPRSQQSKCPGCGQPLPSPLPACSNCWNVFALPKDITHHELLGLPYGPNPFVVDLPALKQRFRAAQSVCHPDSWASKNPEKLDVAQALSARVNHAYQTLLEPLSRIEYILEQHRLPLSETEKVQDPEFMMEIMEAREAIDEAEDRAQVEAIFEENTGRVAETIKELEKLVEEEDWPAAKLGAIRLRYLQGIQRAAKRWLDNH